MRQMRKALILSAAGCGAVGALLTAPVAGADPCQQIGGGTYGGQTTECVTPGNAQIDATPQYYPGENAMGGMFYGFPGFGF